MVSFAELLKNPKKLGELKGAHVLVSSKSAQEEVVSEAGRENKPEATMVFMHETIEMMQAQRQEKFDKLRELIKQDAPILALQKKPESFWDHVTTGRAASADIPISDPAASNMHAHFELEVGDVAVSIQDEGSSNGTFLNLERLQPHQLIPLQSGDCLRIGQSIFYYLHHDTLKALLQPE